MTDLTFPALFSEYAQLWDGATVRPEHAAAVAQAVTKLNSLKTELYDPVSTETKVPWYVIGLIHCLEAGFNKNTHLHNGDPLGQQTTHVPAGRPPTPPFNSWTHSAVDALTQKGMQNVPAWNVERIAFELERYNGWGYRKFHPEVKTPYLWSFTTAYTKGKYIADGKFDSEAVSQQVGAMALLKVLIEQGLTVPREDGSTAAPPKPPEPIPTGQFQPDGSTFDLRSAPDTPPSDDALVVMFDTKIDKLAEVGDGTWWQIKANWSDGSTDTGFARKDWLRPILTPVVIKTDAFARACLDAARRVGNSAHFLIALADAETGVANSANKAAFGPFALTPDDWKAYNDPAITLSGDAARFNPYSQAAVAALMVAKLTTDLQALLPDKRLPTSEELYLARILGAKGVPKLLAADAGAKKVRDLLTAPDYTQEQVGDIFDARPSLLTGGITVQALRSAVVAKIEAGFVKAVASITAVEPDLVIGPPEATDAGAVPWMAIAKAELDAGVTAATNPARVMEYLNATDTLPHNSPASTPWCAAFLCWCIKQSGKVDKVRTFSALAADWLKNGDNLPGPQFGAVGITKPLVSGDSGHVGFITTFDGSRIKMIGGNQGHHVVSEVSFPVSDFVGFRMM